MAKVPASGPGPNTATNNSAQTNELIDREGDEHELCEQIERQVRRDVAGGKQSDGNREHDRDDGAHRGDVQGLDQAGQCRFDIAGIERPQFA